MAANNKDGAHHDETDANLLKPIKKAIKKLSISDSGDTSGKDDIDAKGVGEVVATPQKEPNESPEKDSEDIQFVYNMNNPKRGIAVIFNNETFLPQTNQKQRKGTDVDASSMHAILGKLGFEVYLRKDQTVAEMRKIIKDASELDHSKNDAFVMVILSHGNEQGVYGTDAVISVDKLISPFKGDKCQSLAGKPKLFFIQACRGDKYDQGTSVESDAQVEKKQTIPTEADILIAYSVVPGYYAWRHTKNGSWFIRSVCKVLEKYGEEREILWMMTRVNALVAYNFESNTLQEETDGKKQIPAITSMLTKELYFRPKPN